MERSSAWRGRVANQRDMKIRRHRRPPFGCETKGWAPPQAWGLGSPPRLQCRDLSGTPVTLGIAAANVTFSWVPRLRANSRSRESARGAIPPNWGYVDSPLDRAHPHRRPRPPEHPRKALGEIVEDGPVVGGSLREEDEDRAHA